MAKTYPELLEEWESKIEGHLNATARTAMTPCDTGGEVRAVICQWRMSAELADEILTELKVWREQAAGHEASRALLQERFDEQAQELREVSARLSWLEENARRMQRGLEELATCPWCGRFDVCEEGCEWPGTHDNGPQPEIVAKARETLGEFRL